MKINTYHEWYCGLCGMILSDNCESCLREKVRMHKEHCGKSESWVKMANDKKDKIHIHGGFEC